MTTTNPEHEFKKGEVLTITQGCYSDYMFTGPFMIEKDFNIMDTAQLFIDGWKPEPNVYPDEPGISEFMAFLTKENYISDIPTAREIHLGEYSFEINGRNFTREWDKANG